MAGVDDDLSNAIPDGYGGVTRPGGIGGNRPDWRKGRLTADDLKPVLDDEAPAHWTERTPEGQGAEAQPQPAARFWNRVRDAAPVASARSSRSYDPSPTAPRRRWWKRLPRPSRKWIKRGALLALILFLLILAWLAFTAPPSQTAQPIAPPRLTILASNGTPIASKGAIVGRPVRLSQLPPSVKQAFLATEDRRFYSHWGIDPFGIARAMWGNLRAGSARQGGSTITQQLAKITYLSYDRTVGRKLREFLIAPWLEAWLTKDEILERYLSNVYFGDNVYGLRAASQHYFSRPPEKLTLAQSAMLAGLVKAPSRLAPTKNLKGAQARTAVVLAAMADAGFITVRQARATAPASLRVDPMQNLPSGTYFADWALPQLRDAAEAGYGDQRITTTLDARLQNAARNAVARAPLRGAQVALVAMRPNGEIVAMVGGRSYDESAFNRATQARRQPGSTFKLFTYLTALREGRGLSSTLSDRPIADGAYRPKNYGNAYGRDISLTQAFAKSSNVAALRLYEELGGGKVIKTARDLGVRSPLTDTPSLALGTSGMTLLELTAAYAGVAGNRWPVDPHPIKEDEPGFFASLIGNQRSFSGSTSRDIKTLLKAVVDEGTGRAARLAVPAYGKTGTSQDSRDALFIGFAGDLVVGVWVGRDDNLPIKGISGGGIPARIWKDFMMQAIPRARLAAPPPRKPSIPMPGDIPVDLPTSLDLPRLPEVNIDQPDLSIEPGKGVTVRTGVNGVPLDIRVGRDGVAIGARGEEATPANPTPAQPAATPPPR